MARFGRDIVKSLTQPAFADLTSDVGMLLGGLPGKRREEEARQDRLQRETDVFTIYEQGLRSSEDANVAGVTAASKKLSGMLTDEVDETVRSDLMTKISALGKLQETTQTAKDQRNITDLIQAENLLDDLEQKGDARTENENAANIVNFGKKNQERSLPHKILWF